MLVSHAASPAPTPAGGPQRKRAKIRRGFILGIVCGLRHAPVAIAGFVDHLLCWP